MLAVIKEVQSLFAGCWKYWWPISCMNANNCGELLCTFTLAALMIVTMISFFVAWPSGWYRPGTATCYQFVDTQTDWESACSACQLKGADLAQMTSHEKARKMKIICANEGKYVLTSRLTSAILCRNFMWIGVTNSLDNPRCCILFCVLLVKKT